MPDASQYQSSISFPVATIANGQSASAAVDVFGACLCGVYLPDTFDGTAISFRAGTSLDGPFYDVQDGDGALVSRDAEPEVYIPLEICIFVGVRYLQVISDTNQTGPTNVVLAVRPV